MDSIPIEYSERMMAEQMAMMDALQFIAQLLICFALLVAFVILIVNISGIGPIRHSERPRPNTASRRAAPRGGNA